jgi:hypothetical protein
MTGAFSPKLVAPGEGKTVMLFGVRFSHPVLSADAAGSLAVEVEIPPGTLVKPNNHSHGDEFSLVLSGTAGARKGDRVLEAGPSACLVRPGHPACHVERGQRSRDGGRDCLPASWRAT